MKRIGIVVGFALAFVLGAGAMAQSPTLATSPAAAHAPDDLVPVLENANPLPAVDWSIDGGGGVVMEDLLGLDAVLDLLDAVDGEPNDIRFALGRTINQPLDDMLNLYIVAVRVAGTPADMLVEPLVRILSGTPPDEWPSGATTGWRDIDGRAVLVLLDEVQPDDWEDYGAGQQRWFVAYPVGEILFVALKDGVVPLGIDEVLGELP